MTRKCTCVRMEDIYMRKTMKCRRDDCLWLLYFSILYDVANCHACFLLCFFLFWVAYCRDIDTDSNRRSARAELFSRFFSSYAYIHIYIYIYVCVCVCAVVILIYMLLLHWLSLYAVFFSSIFVFVVLTAFNWSNI